MSDLQVGDIVHLSVFKSTDRKCQFFVVERFCLKRYFYWSGNKKVQSKPDIGAVLAPCNARTLTKVPGRKTTIEALVRLRRLNLLEVLAKVR